MQLATRALTLLQQLPWQSDLQTCTPEEQLVYLQLEYLPKACWQQTSQWVQS